MVVLATVEVLGGMLVYRSLVSTGHVDPGGRASAPNQTFVWTNAVIMGDNSDSLSNNSISTGSLPNSSSGGPCRPSKPNTGIFSDAATAPSDTGSSPAATSDTASDPVVTSITASDPAAASDGTNSFSKPVACRFPPNPACQSPPTPAHRSPQAHANSQTTTCGLGGLPKGMKQLWDSFGDCVNGIVKSRRAAQINVAQDAEEAIAAVSQGDFATALRKKDDALPEEAREEVAAVAAAHQQRVEFEEQKHKSELHAGVVANKQVQDEAPDEASADQPKADAAQYHGQTAHETYAWLMSQRLEALGRLSQPASVPDHEKFDELQKLFAETTDHLLNELASNTSRLEAFENMMEFVYEEMNSRFIPLERSSPARTAVVAIQIEESLRNSTSVDKDPQNDVMGDGGRTQTLHLQHHMIASDDESEDLQCLPFPQSNLKVTEIRPSDLPPVNLRLSADLLQNLE